MFKRSRGIGFRLWAGFGLLIVLLVGQSAFSVLQFRKLQVQADALVQQHIGLLSAVGQMHDLAGLRQVSLRDLAAAKDEQRVEQVLTALQANGIQWDGVAHRFTTVADTAELERVRDASRIIVAAAADIKVAERKLLDLPPAEQTAEARAQLVQDTTPRYQELNAMLRGFFSATKADADASIARNAKYLHNLLILIAAVAAAALVFGASIAYFSTRGVVRPLALAREAASRVAQGDLSQELQRKGPGEIVELVGTLEEMRLSLAQAVTGIRQAADGVQDGSRRIELGNLSLSERTEEQASSLEETASSIEELTATVKQNADSAARASVLARDTTSVARRGGAAVRDVVATMQGIHEASRRIGDIIGVIDGIAFQTNILALNAAVEAARAGEQGRGFAVVAAEVRGLAQRAAMAAKEIKTLIHDSVGRVDGGVHQVEAAGRTMDEIVQSATQADGVIAEIAAASAEQFAGIEQVNRAIVQMEGNTQQNAAMVEEASAAAEHLSRQADLLVSAVAKFQLEGQSVDGHHDGAGSLGGEAAGQRLLRVPPMRRPALGSAA